MKALDDSHSLSGFTFTNGIKVRYSGKTKLIRNGDLPALGDRRRYQCSHLVCGAEYCSMKQLEFRNLTLGYELHPAVHHLSAAIEQGALTAVVGPNGAGKSTLLKGIMGQLRPLEGEILLHGLDRRAIAYLPQQSLVDRSFPITVEEIVSLGVWNDTGAFGRVRSKHKRRVQAALQRVGLIGFENRLLSTLSGGQMQRVLFARLLVQEADLILLDEPFTGIDAKTTQDLLELIKHWHESGKTIVAVLHELDVVRDYFPQTLLLSRQLVAFGETKNALTEATLAQARRFTEAFDDEAEPCLHAPHSSH